MSKVISVWDKDNGADDVRAWDRAYNWPHDDAEAAALFFAEIWFEHNDRPDWQMICVRTDGDIVHTFEIKMDYEPTFHVTKHEQDGGEP